MRHSSKGFSPRACHVSNRLANAIRVVLTYRFYEIVQVYGTTFKALIHELFPENDGITSAIDFEMDIQRKADPKGDRVVLTMDGKFLPYRKW
ncbi:MAG: hypothetical protein NVS4B8_20560 [Herpetosiphon sp.]